MILPNKKVVKRTQGILMRIGLSGTFWGLETTGSGQYVRHLLQALASLAPEEELTLFLPRYLGDKGPAQGAS